MKRILFALLAVTTLVSCNDADKGGSSDSAVDAARNFIRSALDGDYQKARTYMVSDSLNTQDFDAIVRLNDRLTAEDKKNYKEASIRIHNTRVINDSAAVITYSNTFRKKEDSLKVVKLEGKWLVDFKYMFNHKTDSL